MPHNVFWDKCIIPDLFHTAPAMCGVELDRLQKLDREKIRVWLSPQTSVSFMWRFSVVTFLCITVEYAFMGSLIIREVIKDLTLKGIKQAKVIMLAGTR